jgi:hypothetical protein
MSRLAPLMGIVEPLRGDKLSSINKGTTCNIKVKVSKTNKKAGATRRA